MTKDRPPQRVQLRFICVLVALATIWLSMLVWGAGALDRSLYETLYAGNRPVLRTVAHFFTALGEPTFLIAACAASALWLWYAGRARLGVVLLLVAMLGRGLTEAQKY